MTCSPYMEVLTDLKNNMLMNQNHLWILFLLVLSVVVVVLVLIIIYIATTGDFIRISTGHVIVKTPNTKLQTNPFERRWM